MRKIFYVLLSALFAGGVVTGCQEGVKKSGQEKQTAVDTALVMHITYKIKPDRVADFKRAFDRCAVETLKEPGCLKYEIYQSYNDTTLFFLLEKWQHKQAHQNHSQTEHLKAYFKAIEGAFDQGGSCELLRIPPAIEAE